VMTDGKSWIVRQEIKAFDVRDGMGSLEAG
jgi:3-deoxy-D-manno-octulosonate 8-phosphate phosphatase KdsC-like HAD superfamily phosphatase